MAWTLVQGAATDITLKTRLSSIVVNEAGPGAVSSMYFTVVDPTKAVTFSKRDKITWTEPGGVVQFLGYVEHVEYRPVAIGREIDVECTGAEAILDWLLGQGTGAILAATNFPNAVNQIITTKTASLNAVVDVVANQTGSAAKPIGSWVDPVLATTPFLTGGVNWTPALGTLRQQIEQLVEKCAYNLGGGAFQGFGCLLTIDFSLGVRCWEDKITLQPTDYTTLTVTTAGPLIQSDLLATKDWAAVPDRVWVVGTGITGFRPTAAGSFPRREVILNDPAIATAAERDMAGDNYLIGHGVEDRGEFDLIDFAPTRTVHAGSLLSITDAMTGITGTYRIGEIRKTYNDSGRENWHVTYGRLAPSLARMVTTGAR